MSELTAEQQQALEEQKKNCVFCRIIEGEIPAKKVYEDEHMLAILDINPLVKGHTLVMPKEHYPIMPLIPQETFVHMFEKTRELADAVKKGLLATGTTILIANGQVAGQMSPHFMFHIIPRENGDGIDLFSTEGKASQPTEEIFKSLSNNLPMMVENHLKKYPQDWHTPRETTQKFTKEQVIEIIEKNEQLKEFILKSPQDFLSQVGSHEQLKKIFADVDPVEIIQHYVPDFTPEKQEAPQPSPSQGQGGGTEKNTQEQGAPGAQAPGGSEKQHSSTSSQSTSPSPEDSAQAGARSAHPSSQGPSQAAQDKSSGGGVDPSQIQAATAMAQQATEGIVPKPEEVEGGANQESDADTSEHEAAATSMGEGDVSAEAPGNGEDEALMGIFETIDGNPKLRQLVLADTEKLKEKCHEVPQLQQVFQGYDIEEVCGKYDEREKEIKEILSTVDQNPKLKEMLQSDPAAVREKMQSVPQLKEMFKGYDPELIQRHMIGDSR